MKEEVISKEDLDQRNPTRFQGKWTFNNFQCGTGKTKKSCEIVRDCLISGQRIDYVPSTHDLASEIDKRLNVASNHIYGKKWLCELEGVSYPYPCSNFEECYDCVYFIQWKLAKKFPVNFKTIHSLQLSFEKYGLVPDTLIVDESIDSWVYRSIDIPDGIDYDAIKITCNTCKFANRCKDPKKKFGETYGCYYQLFFEIKLEDFEPKTEKEYLFKQNFNDLETVYAIKETTGKYSVIGKKNMDFLKDVPMVIFNCATTPSSVAEKVFGRKFDVVLKNEEGLKNEIWIAEDFMSKTKTAKELENAFDYFEIMNIPLDDSLLITKIDYEGFFEDFAATEHYGNTRGTNKFEHLNNVVLFGRFGLPPGAIMLLNYHGQTFPELKALEKAEEVQSLHRIRPILYPEKKVFLFSNSLLGMFENERRFKLNELKICRDILKGDLEGLTKTEIKNRIGKNNNDRNHAYILLQEFGWITWINDHRKKGKTLKYLRKPSF